MAIIITILIFGVIVLIHEYGHFIVAKKSGVFIEEFAIGMGPKLLSKEKNGTLYSIRLFPLGGFCKMKGEDETDKDEDSFSNISVFKRMLIVLAGPFMNFFLAFLIFLSFVLSGGFISTTVSKSIDGFPAKQAGIKEGDIIKEVNGKKTRNYDDITYYISQSNGNEPIELKIKRNKENLKINVVPKFDETTERYVSGIIMIEKAGLFEKDSDFEKVGIIDSIREAFWDMAFTIKITITGLKDLLTLKLPIDSIVGPIGITPIISETYETAISYSFLTMVKTMLNLTALLSANIGLMNLIPIPALDGGRMIFLIFEAIRKKPISQEKESMAHIVGFVILIAFGIFIAFKDITRLF